MLARGGGVRCYGVAQLLEAGSTTVAQASYFKLLPEDDFTGSIDFSGLEPGLRLEIFDRKGARLHDTSLNLDG